MKLPAKLKVGQINRAITEFENAVYARASLGAAKPGEHVAIERNYHRKKSKLLEVIERQVKASRA